MGALYDGGGDTYHPFFHLSVGARVDYGVAGIEALHSPANVRGVVDLYALRLVGNRRVGDFAILGGVGYSLWRRWTDAPHKESSGISTTLGLEYEADPAVVEVRWEWFADDRAPIRNAALLLMGIRID